MKHTLVSVIVPVYNMELYLEETLSSILASDYPNIEVILMDDGSKDGSWEIMQRYASLYSNVSAYTQANGGVSSARNHAIRLAKGTYILPVDADNRISNEFVRLAVDELERDKDVKVVCSRAEFFGDKTGEWKQPRFSLKLLARKNMIDNCAMYRKADWERVGGYCKDIKTREDWAFWISILKDGGKVVRINHIGLFYRIRPGSKRVANRYRKREVIDILNRLHPEFFDRMLHGPLRYQRTWSSFFNRIHALFHYRKLEIYPKYEALSSFVLSLHSVFDKEGEVLHKGRNEVKAFHYRGFDLVVKSYHIPRYFNRIIYGFFRPSKAERSYRYAWMLKKKGIGTPEAVGFVTYRRWFLFEKSYLITIKSECSYTYRDFATCIFDNQNEILRSIAHTTALLHKNNLLHKDYSAGNILFQTTESGIDVEIIDLNRMRFGRVSMAMGCRNFERLPGTHEMFLVIAKEYAKERGFNYDDCLNIIEHTHIKYK
ncbi:glycosyltransferase [Bacteroides sp.]